MEEASTLLFQWFHNNLLKSILDSCHLLISSNENITVKIGEYETENSECENLLGSGLLVIVFLIYVKISRGKLNTLAKIAPFTGLYKRRIPRNYLNKNLAYTRMSFFNSQFNYCTLFGSAKGAQ